MSTPNPLVPQGSLPAGGTKKPNVRFFVFTAIIVHVVFLGGLLMVGCSKDDKNATKLTAAQTNAEPAMPPLDTNPPVVAPTNFPAVTNAVVNPGGPATNMVVAPQPVAPEPSVDAGAKDYVIQKGDILAKIAKTHHTSVNAILKLNAGLDPKKLKVGQKIQLPGDAAAPTAVGTTATGAGVEAGPTSAYTVKAGDTLAKIARTHGTTIKAIQGANGLKTTQIRVNQKLKLPAKATATATAGDGAAAAESVAPSNTPAAAPLSPAPGAVAPVK